MHSRPRHGIRRGAIAALALAAALVASGQGGARPDVLPTLYVAYVGTNCTFTITGDNGAKIATIPPGTYQMVFDQNDFESCPQLPDFVLQGPGVSIETPIDAGTGDAAEFTPTFQPAATYVGFDGNQPALSRFTFTTAASGAPAQASLPPSTATNSTRTSSTDVVGSRASSARFRGTLIGSVSQAGKLTLTFNGTSVHSLVQGTYRVVVADHSRTGGFIVQEAHRAARTVTGTSFVGNHTVTISLTPGQGLFYSTFVGAKRSFIVVAPPA